MFDAVAVKNDIVRFIRDYYTRHNIKGAVLGISGGKDSAVVAALLVEALGANNVVGISMPCHSIPKDRDLAKVFCEKYGIRLYNCDLTDTFDTMEKSILDGYTISNEENRKNSSINLKPRLRMSTVYYYAAMLSDIENGLYLVAGTSNKCERFVGYFTKGGDNVYDIAPIADLTVDEVIAVGEVLGVPHEILHRPPSDGLSGMTDEDKLGVKYSDIAKYINGEELDQDIKDKIERLHQNSRHKFDDNIYRKNI
jgi:NAD+ synthase